LRGDVYSIPWKNDGKIVETCTTMYSGGDYDRMIRLAEEILNDESELIPSVRAGLLILLAVVYEKKGENNISEERMRELKNILDRGDVDEVPALPGIDLESLSAYEIVFEESPMFKYKDPTEVSKMIEENVVYAPRKSIEQKQVERKKKKLPWLLVIGAVLVVGTAAVIILTAGKDHGPVIPEIEWVKIPAGEFLMGDNFYEGDSDELPVHAVYLDEYYISKCEITYRQYNAYRKDTDQPEIPTTMRVNSPFLPITNVSWNDAVQFCRWLSSKTGQNIQLPTEAQWEKAARGTGQLRFPWGNSPADCGKAAMYGCGMHSEMPSSFYETGKYVEGQSPYGVFEMAGNAIEWVRDWYDPNYYNHSPQDNPTGPGSGIYRVARGGGIASSGNELRSANRIFYRPEYYAVDVGFRIVKID